MYRGITKQKLREVLVQRGLLMESWKMLYQRKEAKTKYGWKFPHFSHFHTRIRYRIDRYNHFDMVMISRMHMWHWKGPLEKNRGRQRSPYCKSKILIKMKSDFLMKKNKYPWIVALILKSDDSHFCGGTLVASKYIISAAHCMWFDFAQTTLLKKNQFQVLKNNI